MKMNFALPAAALLAAALSAPAMAAIPVYTPVGTQNPTAYTFTADRNGRLEVFYLGGITTGYFTQLTLLVNGVERGGNPAAAIDPKAPNWLSTWGSRFNFGQVAAGDSLVWKLTHILPPTVTGQEIFSDVGMNGGWNNIFSTSYAGGDFGVPLGSYTFVAFEDIFGRNDPLPGFPDRVIRQDWDYNDFRFAFNVVPEPATWAMLIAGFGLVGLAMRRRKASIASVAA